MSEIGKAITDAINVAVNDTSEAISVINQHIGEYLQGGPDRRLEDTELGRKAGLNLELVQERWDVAKRQFQDRKLKERESRIEEGTAVAVFKKPEVQPSVGQSKSEIAKPQVVGWRQRPGGIWEYRLEGQSFWRRHFGPAPKHVAALAKPVVQLKVVEQAKPEPEPEAEEPKKKAAVAPVKNEVAVVKAAPLGFQHLKNPVGIPASLENAIKAIDKLGAECSYDVFHDRIIVKGHECGVRGDAHENLENDVEGEASCVG